MEAGLHKINYEAGPIAAKFHLSNASVRGLMGPVGSGKSVACCFEMFRRSQEQKPGADGIRRTRWLVVRNTLPQLETTTIKTWVDWFPPEIFGRMTGKPPYTHYLKYADINMEVIFIALDKPEDVKKLLSLECTGIWFNEAREINKEIVDAATARVGRYPAKKDGGCSWYGIIMDTNPPTDDHWWYYFAEEQSPEDWEFFRQPSGLSANAENIHNLPEGYYRKMMAGKDEEWIKVYVKGEYGFISDGKPIYNNYNDEIHFSSKVEYNPRLPLYLGIDFGLTPAAAFLQRGAMGNWVAIDELIAVDMGAKRFGAILRKYIQENNYYIEGDFHREKINITGDPAGEQRTQSDESTPYEMLKSEGIYAKAAPTNDFTIRVEVVTDALGKLIDGVPGLVIGPKCKQLRKAMNGGYKYRKLNVSGGVRFSDKPEKNIYSHIAEALQYGMLGGGEGRAVIKSYNRNGNKSNANSSSNYDELTY